MPRPAYILLPKSVARALPALGSTDSVPLHGKVAVAKFFTPWTCWTWYAVEYDGADTFFGYVKGLEDEWGYFSRKELEDLRGPAGLRIERDLHFRPRPIGDVCPELMPKPCTVGDVLIHRGEPDGGNPYRGQTLMGDERVTALQALCDANAEGMAPFSYWYGPAHGGARRILSRAEVRWDTSGIKPTGEET